MATTDPRIDAYIAKSAPFARPILTHLRDAVHAACPEVEETLKWSAPHFMYKGMLGGMAAFKQHCAFGFWKGKLIMEGGGAKAQEAMGQFGRITTLADLPPAKVLAGYIKEAIRLNETGVKAPAPRRSTGPRPELPVPEELERALARNRKARSAFEAFSASHRREYVEWIAEAKGKETRTRRVAQAIEWLAEGKSRNWMYTKR